MAEHPDGPAAAGCLFYLAWEPDYLGGVDIAVERLYRLISARPGGATRTWIGVQDWQRQGEQVDPQGRRFLHLNLPAAPVGGLLPWLRYAFSLGRRLLPLARQLAEHRIEVVNCHFPTSNVFALAALKRLGLWSGRLVLSFHGSDVRMLDPASMAWKAIARASDDCIVCSEALADELAARGLWSRSRLTVIHNGIDAAAFADPAHHDDPKDVPQRFILNVGNYVALKAQDALLNVFARLRTTDPDLVLVFAGGKDDGVWLARLREHCSALGLDDRVRFRVDVPHGEVPNLMKRAVALVHTSEREGLPLVLLEAGALGVPVLASRVGGIPELIEHGRSGLLHDCRDEAQLLSQLREVVQDAHLRSVLAEGLHERVARGFSADRMAERYAEVLFGTPARS